MIQGQVDHELYEDIERELMPIIRSAARRFAPGLGISTEDAVQEGRLALMLALKGYDYNASKGGIYNFARKTIRNAMCGLLYSATTQSRCPRVVMEENGELVVVKMWPALTDVPEVHPDRDAKTPEELAIESEFTDKIRVLRMRLVNRLNPFQLKVLSCISRNNVLFETFLRNRDEPEATHALIGEWLGMGMDEDGEAKLASGNRHTKKNAVDWAVHRIKQHFTVLMEAEFSDIVEEAIQAGKWPMFYVSTKQNDKSFIQGIIEKRSLDARPISSPEIKARTGKDGTRAVRHIETYSWGSVIMLSFGENAATVVAEGRFNAISGEVLQPSGSWKSILDVVPWYVKASHFINEKG